MSEYKNIWSLIELENGQAKKVGLELLAGGRQMADAMGEKLVAVVIGSGTDAAVKSAVSYGADQVLVVDGADYAEYNAEGYTYALEQLVNKYKPAAILMGSTINGRALAPRVAARLKTGLMATVPPSRSTPRQASSSGRVPYTAATSWPSSSARRPVRRWARYGPVCSNAASPTRRGLPRS
jgi:electron transfer flavoprotein alpha subunit